MNLRRVIPWFRVQSDVDEHGKILPLSDAAFRVWMCSLAFSKRTTSRGFVPMKKAIALAAATDAVTEMSRVTSSVTSEVTSAGLWTEVDGGFLLTNWKKHQTDPAERTQEQRDKDRDRKKKQRENTNVPLSSPLSESLSLSSEKGVARASDSVFAAIIERHPIPVSLDATRAEFYSHVEPGEFHDVDVAHVAHCERWAQTDPAFIPELHNWLKDWRKPPRALPQVKASKPTAEDFSEYDAGIIGDVA